MAKAKEFTVTIEDKPGVLGKCCLALAENGVNILAFNCMWRKARAWRDSWWTIRPAPMRHWANYE